MTTGTISMERSKTGATVGRERKKVSDKTYSGRLAIRIRELREAREKTVQDIADACGVPVATYYQWENGRLGINPDRYPALAKALGVSIGHLFPKS